MAIKFFLAELFKKPTGGGKRRGFGTVGTGLILSAEISRAFHLSHCLYDNVYRLFCVIGVRFRALFMVIEVRFRALFISLIVFFTHC